MTLEKIKRKNSIIDAAVIVFSKKGYHNAKMEEIAVEAGIGKGTIYEYFSSKLNLFQEIMNHSIEKYYDKVSSQLTDSISMEQRLRFIMQGHFQFCMENRELTRIVFWDTEIIDEELKVWTYNLRKDKEYRMQALIERSILQGELRQLDANLITLLITGVLAAIWAPIVVDGQNYDAEKLADEVVDIIMNGIKAR